MTRDELDRQLREQHMWHRIRQAHEQGRTIDYDDLDLDPDPAPVPGVADEDTLLTQREVLEYVPWDRTTLWRKTTAGLFPMPIRLAGSRRIVWRKSVILKWISEQC